MVVDEEDLSMRGGVTEDIGIEERNDSMEERGPGLESTLSMDCGGAETRRDCVREGIAEDIRGIGVALGERVVLRFVVLRVE